MNITWNSDKTLTIDPPKRPKKITGTRLASILGLNKWSTPFATWCEITKTYQEPFEDTIYTIAGKTIEPKQAEFVKRYCYVPDLVTPTSMFGADYFKRTFGDFFPEIKIFGGMWDYLEMSKGNVETVFEMKTTKRSEDWETDIPEYYAIQAALYAYLLKCDRVVMVCSFLGEEDYADPNKYVPTRDNTIIRSFSVKERYPNFKRDYLDVAERWWEDHVERGISPQYTDADKDIIKALKKDKVEGDDTLQRAMLRAAEIRKKLAENDELEKELKKLESGIKAYLLERLENDPNLNEIECAYPTIPFSYNVSKSVKNAFSVDDFKAENEDLYNKYIKQSTTYTMRVKEIKK